MIGFLLPFLFLIHATEAGPGMAKPPPRARWQTLTGNEPEVIARGGFSGLFPDSSFIAYDTALRENQGTIMYCDIQFSKDGLGFCTAEINLQNTTNIPDLFPKGQRTYRINGQDIHGWFGLDFPSKILFEQVTIMQNLFSRPYIWDYRFPLGPPDVITQAAKDIGINNPRVWINVQYDAFYNQHRISPERYLLENAMEIAPSFISSPEVGFLKSIGAKLNRAKTKLIFKFLEADLMEPTTKEKYGALVNKLSLIKAFASGILVPKEYIWPVDNSRMLQLPTTLVSDAHKVGLEVYAYGFANDNPLSYNYSYDPAKEYLQFVENNQFSVDGVLTDFPGTAIQTFACFAHNQNHTRVTKALIISHDGASGDFPGSTDLAYQKAIDDGVDILDCSVQMTKDGVAFCLASADLSKATTAVSLFMDRTTKIPEIQNGNGIFSFDLTWSEIQTLKPQIQNLFEDDLVRNPLNKNKGKFVTLSEFLELAKTKAVTGVLIDIKNAAYLGSKKGLDLIGAVNEALSNATFDKQSTQKVLIKSDDSSVLLKFKDNPNYQRVLNIEEPKSGVSEHVAREVKKYADAIVVKRDAVITSTDSFSLNETNIIPAMHAANVTVYVGIFSNEYPNLMFDFNSDPYMELATFIALGADGVMTDYPATANLFMRSPCNLPDSEVKVAAVLPGKIVDSLAEPGSLPPAEAPAEPLSSADIVDPPLPPIAKVSNDTAASSTSTNSPSSSPNSSSSKTTLSKPCIAIAAMVGLLSIMSV